MPFRKWMVEPVYLYREVSSGKDLKRDNDGDKGHELETVVNVSLVKCLRQLASVVKVADRIFEDVGSECRMVYERIERLRIKVGTCRDATSKLNARAVKVPISSDLCTLSKQLRQKKPYKTTYPQRSQLFLPSNRPPCIDELYKDASASPVSVICTVDKYRTDGRTSSELFMVTPVLGGEDTRNKRRRKMLDIETRKPANFSLARSEQDDSKTGGDELTDVDEPKPSTSFHDDSRTTTLDRLPSPEEQTMALSLEYPSSVVPVDVSGSSFLRMTSCRRSLIHADFVIKRRKAKGKQKRRHTVCEGNNKELEKALQNITMVNSSCQTDDLASEAPPTTFFRRSFYRRRAKSMEGVRRETVALDGLNIDLSSKRSESSNQSSQADGLNGTSTLTNSKKDRTQASSTTKKQGKFSLMTRAAANPILNSLSSALSSAAVRLRHPTRSSKQDVDGRSSSGNWSASSSTRASVDSDQHHAAVLAAVDRSSNLSRSSAGKDSLLSEATQHESIRSQEHGSGQVPTLESLSDKARALRNIPPWEYDRGRESCNSTPERSSDCASTPLVISPYITRRNRFNFYAASSSIDDGESSVYSVDTDGYYTSMHTDSGLWNGLGNPKNSDLRGRHRRESQSSISTIGNISVNSILSRTVTETSETGSFKIQRFAPDPPPRSSSSDQKTVVNVLENPSGVLPLDLGSENQSFDKESSPPRNNGSASESDYEAGDRIRCKTTINSSRYPSLCAVSPETSDDELAELREKSISPTVSIVVAEVHRSDDSGVLKKPESSTRGGLQMPNLREQQPASPGCINMYGSSNDQSPAKSQFNSSLIRSGQINTSTPKHSSTTISSFAAETTDNVKDSSKQTDDHHCRLSPITKPFSSVKFREMTAVAIPSVPSINAATAVTPMPKLVPPSSKQEQTSQDSKTDTVKTAKSKSFLKNPLNSLPFRQTESNSPKPSKSSPPSYISFQSPDSPVSSSTALSMDNIMASSGSSTIINQSKSYLSHSLDRSKSHNSSESVDWGTSHSATLPRYHQSSTQSPETRPEGKVTVESEIPPFRQVSPRRVELKPPLPAICQQPDQSQRPAQSVFFRPSRGGRFCRTYFPSHLISPRDQPSPSSEQIRPTSNESRLTSPAGINEVGLPQTDPYPQPPKITRTLFPSNYSPSAMSRTGNVCDSPVQFTSSPALPGKWNSFRGGGSTGESSVALRVPAATYKFQPLPLKTSSLTPVSNPRQALVSVSTPTTARILDQVTRHKTDVAKDFTPQNPPDLIPSSSTPPSTLDITSRTCPNRTYTGEPQRNRLKSLSPNELFAIIHDSKKKHNIRNESLSPLSSRSSSPSPSKTQRIESSHLSSPSMSGGSVNDRFGKSKPTSMHDFKMLLLQTRSGSHESKPSRPSAAELLKVSPTRRSLVTGSPASPVMRQQVSSPSWPRSRMSPSSLSPQGHQQPIMPVKRSMRTRSPYLTRYDSAYPPIWEDCSEDLEDAADENRNPVVNSITLAPVEEVLGNGNRYRCNPAINRTILDNQQPSRTSTWV